MTAKANRYHDTLISFDSAYNSRGVTVFHKCYFTLNGLMECIYIAFCTHFFTIVDITSLYSAIHATHITHRAQHAH